MVRIRSGSTHPMRGRTTATSSLASSYSISRLMWGYHAGPPRNTQRVRTDRPLAGIFATQIRTRASIIYSSKGRGGERKIMQWGSGLGREIARSRGPQLLPAENSFVSVPINAPPSHHWTWTIPLFLFFVYSCAWQIQTTWAVAPPASPLGKRTKQERYTKGISS